MSKFGVFYGPYFPTFGLNTDQKKLLISCIVWTYLFHTWGIYFYFWISNLLPISANSKIDLHHYAISNCIKVLYLRIRGKEYNIKTYGSNSKSNKKKKKNILEKLLKALVLMFYRNVYVICLTEISVFHLLDAIIDLFK